MNHVKNLDDSPEQNKPHQITWGQLSQVRLSWSQGRSRSGQEGVPESKTRLDQVQRRGHLCTLRPSHFQILLLHLPDKDPFSWRPHCLAALSVITSCFCHLPTSMLFPWTSPPDLSFPLYPKSLLPHGWPQPPKWMACPPLWPLAY